MKNLFLLKCYVLNGVNVVLSKLVKNSPVWKLNISRVPSSPLPHSLSGVELICCASSAVSIDCM